MTYAIFMQAHPHARRKKKKEPYEMSITWEPVGPLCNIIARSAFMNYM